MDCSICLQIPAHPTTTKCCLNEFCDDCLGNWIRIKNSCPLCGALIGIKLNNSLAKQPDIYAAQGVEFFRKQLTVINSKIAYASQKLRKWRSQSNNLKSSVSSTKIKLLDDHLQLADDYRESMKESINCFNVESASLYNQLLVEVIIELENLLDGKYLTESFHDGIYSDDDEPCYKIRQSGSKRDKQRKKKNDYKGKKVEIEY